MKKFESPEVKLLVFAVEDVITTSNELPIMPMSEGGEGIVPQNS